MLNTIVTCSQGLKLDFHNEFYSIPARALFYQRFNLRIIYYTGIGFLDNVIPLIEALSKLVKVHLVMNMQSNHCRGTIVDMDPGGFKGGIYNGKEFFGSNLPTQIYNSLENLEGFWAVFHPHRNFRHPKAWPMLWKETSFINSLNADILHLDGVSPSIARMIFRLNVPIICSIHDARLHSGEKSWRNSLWRKLAFPHIRHYVVRSNFSKNLLRETYKIEEEKISVIPLGIYSIYKLWHKSKPEKEEDKNILFFGRLSPYKGVEILIEAMKLVCRKLSDVKLVIAGEPMPWYLLPDIPTLENNCQIALIGRYISNNELCQLFQKASICVLPYTDASQSGVALTSLAFHTPVVASNVGGLPEYIIDRETGLLVPPNDPESLAEALMSLLSNNGLRKKMAKNLENGRTGIPAWNQIAQMLAQLYTQLLSDHGQRFSGKAKYG